MVKIDFNKQLFWFIAVFILIFDVLLTYKMYQKEQQSIQERALAKAENLKNYFISMRNVYHHQFLNSNLELNESTVKLLPAYAATIISDKFAELSEDGTAIRSVTDRVRNEKNRADHFEREAIEYFKKNPNKPIQMRKIEQNGKKFFNFTAPLLIEPYCLLCHGKKEETLPSIQAMYDTAYDYKVGDVRGVISIKIPSEKLTYESMQGFYGMAIFSFMGVLFLLVIIYYIIKELTTKDVKQKLVLQNEIELKTSYLQEQKEELQSVNIKQQHLLSILKTVANCNEILITAKNIDEMIQNTAMALHSNTLFTMVRILIFENGELQVKSSIGLNEETKDASSLEEDVFHNNYHLSLKHFDDSLPQECLEKVKKYNITQLCALALRRERYATKALGVLVIYSNKKNGFSTEEENIIFELAGEIGFAINSLHQRDTINQLSYYDRLTNLPNQNLFEQHLEKAFLKSAQSLKYGALLLFDFDDFKTVNDLVGKEVGDEVLKEMTQRFLSQIEKVTVISRLGGDKFLLLVEDLCVDEKKSAIILKNLSQKMVTLAKEPFLLDVKTLHLTCSIGIVLFVDHKIGTKAILNQAEYAVRIAKESGKNIVKFYDQTLQDMTHARSLMTQNLKEAILKDQFLLYYQKQFDSNNHVVGVEALIRWQHPELGFISPGEFIPIAEESDTIKKIGFYVLDQATNLIAKWANDALKKEWRISVNISPKQFKDEDFVENIINLVIAKKIDSKKLRLELTESVAIQNQESAIQKINALKSFGISVSIDDFGTGYSNLKYLKNLNIDELKIDQSFVFGLGKNSSDKTIIKTIIAIGEEFGFEVIAEGVETQEQFEILKNLGCHYFQGYLFAKPSPESELSNTNQMLQS